MTIEGVIFDMDGLLVDTEIVYQKGWLEVFQKENIAISQEEVASWQGQSFHQTQAILDAHGLDTERLKQMREQYIYTQLKENKVHRKPYALEILTFLKARGVKIALASSTARKRGEAILHHLKLEALIEVTCFGDEVTFHKPAPDIYQMTVKKLGLKNTQCLAVEDSLTGAQAAIAANLRVIVVPDSSLAVAQDFSALAIYKKYATLQALEELFDD